MKNKTLLQKYRMFRHFKKILNANRDKLTNKENGLNIRIDKALRIYTVVNCSSDVLKYGKNLAEKEIKEYISQVEKTFIDVGLLEYIGIREITQISELDFLLIFGFKGFDTTSYYSRIRWYILLIIIAAMIFFYFFS